MSRVNVNDVAIQFSRLWGQKETTCSEAIQAEMKAYDSEKLAELMDEWAGKYLYELAISEGDTEDTCEFFEEQFHGMFPQDNGAKFVIMSTNRDQLDLCSEFLTGTYEDVKAKVLADVLKYSVYNSLDELYADCDKDLAGITDLGYEYEVWANTSDFGMMVWKAVKC